jgi:hypothetical protein
MIRLAASAHDRCSIPQQHRSAGQHAARSTIAGHHVVLEAGRHSTAGSASAMPPVDQ